MFIHGLFLTVHGMWGWVSCLPSSFYPEVIYGHLWQRNVCQYNRTITDQPLWKCLQISNAVLQLSVSKMYCAFSFLQIFCLLQAFSNNTFHLRSPFIHALTLFIAIFNKDLLIDLQHVRNISSIGHQPLDTLLKHALHSLAMGHTSHKLLPVAAPHQLPFVYLFDFNFHHYSFNELFKLRLIIPTYYIQLLQLDN